ncbi:MAG: zinc-ribbon domain-containing protein [Eubacteriales bacterium]|nr:zinc-ribbon domain-containing protein [Eubacteriales bacterium]
MYCKNCGEQLNDNQVICVKCGVKVGDGSHYCSNCGKEITPNAEVCMNCGVSAKKSKEYLNGQDKIVLILVCIFLGGFGIHNFIMGETKRGIFRIIMSFFCGLGTIFALIDLVKIATDTYVVDHDKLI